MYLRLKQTGSNQATVSILTGKGSYDFHFSYQTCVAFKEPGRATYVCQNVWSRTTGKHLTNIDGGQHHCRIPAINFATMLEKAFDSIAQDTQEGD